MNIIFGREQAEEMQSRYTILELDSFSYQGQLLNAFCVVEQIPILDMARVESMKALHANLLENYRKCDWNYCEQAIEHLSGFWGEDMDTFYKTLKKRIEECKNKDLADNWWVIVKSS